VVGFGVRRSESVGVRARGRRRRERVSVTSGASSDMFEIARPGMAGWYRNHVFERTHDRDARARLAGQSSRDRTKVRMPATEAWTAKTGVSARSRGIDRSPSRARANLFDRNFASQLRT
jgi:hypothetical protein